MTAPVPSSVLAFVFDQNMNHEDILKEMHSKVHTCTLPNKLTMQAVICITMTYEALWYVPHTMFEYLALINRPAHLAHVAAVAAAILASDLYCVI
jgi:hypothetical protein